MNKRIWIVIPIVIAALCFTFLYLFVMPKHNTLKPQIVVSSMPTTKVVTWYTSVPLENAQRIANAFQMQTGISVNIVRDSALVIKNRLMSEIAAGTKEADVVAIADIATYIDLKNEGYLMKYDSPQYEYYSPADKDPGYWAVFSAIGICMAYDETRLDDPPQHWTDLLDSKWKGRIGLEDINTAGTQYGQYYMLRETLGVDFWKELLSVQQPKIYSSTDAVADALLAGQIDVAGEFSINTVSSYKAKRRTIQGIYPEEGIPLVVTPIAIMNNAVHPAEAKLFLDFLLSQEGQNITQSLSYRYSVRGDVTPLAGIPSLGSLNVLRPESAEDYRAKMDEYIQEFNSYLGGKQ